MQFFLSALNSKGLLFENIRNQNLFRMCSNVTECGKYTERLKLIA